MEKIQIGPAQELLNIQLKLWKRNKEIIENSIVVKEPGFLTYEKKYLRSVAKYEHIATYDELFSAIEASRLVFVGDYHTCNQSQRSFLRILKAILPKKPKIVLCLELIHKRSQKVLDEYMNDRISDGTFLRKIGFEEHWVFDLWRNFKILFDFAKYHSLPVFGIDAAGNKAGLEERDTASAKAICDILKKYPDSIVFVMIGDLHLAHLPQIVRKMRNGATDDLILYQNSEAIYWDLAKQGIEHRVEVVKVREGEFCRLHTPPIVCQQSYINWLEHEEGEIDFADSKASFLELCDQISKFLGINLGSERETAEVYTCGDLSFLPRLKEAGDFSAKEFKQLKRQILASESYFVPERRLVYLANLSVNHAAEEAAHFIKIVCSGVEPKRTREDAFFANIMHEGLAFFGSKLINPKRKCFHEREFLGLISYFQTIRVPQDRRVEFETACFVLDFLKNEKKGLSDKHYEIILSPDVFFSVTHALGYILGDYLFYALMGERISKSDLRALFYDGWKGEGAPAIAYFNLRKKLKGVKIPKRM